MLSINGIDQAVLERLASFYDSIYADRQFQFYHSEVISVDQCFRKINKLYEYTAYTSYKLMKHSDAEGLFFVLCKI